ncbi:unnamed protein product, partial [Amoebophrya sp. A120]
DGSGVESLPLFRNFQVHGYLKGREMMQWKCEKICDYLPECVLYSYLGHRPDDDPEQNDDTGADE